MLARPAFPLPVAPGWSGRSWASSLMLRTLPLPAAHVRAGTDLRTLIRSYAAVITPSPPSSALTRTVRLRVAPRKSKPSSRWTTRVFSSLKASPRAASHGTSRALASSACSRLSHKATRSSAYLTSTGVPGTADSASR